MLRRLKLVHERASVKGNQWDSMWILNLGSGRGEGRRGSKQCNNPSSILYMKRKSSPVWLRTIETWLCSRCFWDLLRIPSGNVVVSLLLSWKVSDSSWWEGEREDLPEEWQSGNTGDTEMVEGKLKKILCPRSCVKKRFLVRFKEVTDSRLSYIWRECGEIKEKRHARSMDGLVTKNNCYSTV